LDVVQDYLRDPYTLDYFDKKEPEEGQPNPKAVEKGLLDLDRALERDRHYVLEVVKLEQPRVQTLSDFGLACAFFFTDEPAMDPKAVAKWFSEPHVGALFDYLISACDGDFAAAAGIEVFESALREFQVAHGIEKLGPVVHPTRVALTGKTTGPGLFEFMYVLGAERMKARLVRAKGML